VKPEPEEYNFTAKPEFMYYYSNLVLILITHLEP